MGARDKSDNLDSTTVASCSFFVPNLCCLGETVMARLTTMGVKAGLSLALGISAMALLGACDNGPSAVSRQQAAGTQMATANAPDRSNGGSDRGGYDNGAPKVDHR